MPKQDCLRRDFISDALVADLHEKVSVWGLGRTQTSTPKIQIKHERGRKQSTKTKK